VKPREPGKEKTHLPHLLAHSDPSFALLLATLRWPDDDRRREAIGRAAIEAIDWRRFAALAVRHRVAPLAFHGVNSARVNVPDWLAPLSRDVRRNALFCELGIAAELTRLQSLFGKAGIDLIALKGPAQSLRSFGRFGMRINRDLDILIPPDSCDAAEALLIDAGYTLVEPNAPLRGEARHHWLRNHKDMVFRSPDRKAMVELHWRLFDNAALMPASTLPRAIPLGIDPLRHIRVLPNDANLRYLCHHGAQHGWSRLKWLADVSALLAGCEPDLLGRLHKPEGDGPDQAAAQALLLCQQLLGAELPADISADLARSSRARWLAKLAWNEILRSDTEEIEARRFGSTIKNASHYALNGGWRYWTEELRFDLTVTPRRQLASNEAGRGRLHGWMRRHFSSR